MRQSPQLAASLGIKREAPCEMRWRVGWGVRREVGTPHLSLTL